jgi:hypothetical protein
VSIALTSFSFAFVSEATGNFQIEESKEEGNDQFVFSNIKSGVNAIIMGCTKGCPEGPQIANWGYKSKCEDIESCLCACGQKIDLSKVQRLVFCNSIVDIKYNLVDWVNNPNKEVKTLHLEAR